MQHLILCFVFVLAISACQNSSSSETPAAEESTETTAQVPEATLPSVPLEILEKIWKEGTQVDYIFYHHPFTMSLNEKPAIQQSVRHIAEDPAPLRPACASAGRVTYQVDGNIVLEGDFYFSTGCTYFVFYEKQEKKYANYMTDEGINYFNNQIKQALELRKKAGQ